MSYDFEHLDDYLDDNVAVSDEVMKLSREERRAQIARLEADAAKEKTRIEEAIKERERLGNSNRKVV